MKLFNYLIWTEGYLHIEGVREVVSPTSLLANLIILSERLKIYKHNVNVTYLE